MISEQSTLKTQFPASAGKPLGTISVIVDNLYVDYKIIGGRISHSQNVVSPNVIRKLISMGRANAQPTVVNAVRGVSFVAHTGESIGIIGTNGSGKSTLLRAIAGLIPPASGRIFIDGECALLGVNAALMPKLTGKRNITLGALAMGFSKEDVEQLVPKVAQFADLGDFLEMPMHAYSSGMASRLRFAIATMKTPDILMIDEALGTGDAGSQKRTQARIEEILAEAGTMFFVSHDSSLVRKMCTRAIWIDKGRMIMDGEANQVLTAYEEFAATSASSTAGAKLR